MFERVPGSLFLVYLRGDRYVAAAVIVFFFLRIATGAGTCEREHGEAKGKYVPYIPIPCVFLGEVMCTATPPARIPGVGLTFGPGGTAIVGFSFGERGVGASQEDHIVRCVL